MSATALHRASPRARIAQVALLAALAALALWMLAWQSSPWPALPAVSPRVGVAAGTLLLYLLGCAWWLRRDRAAAPVSGIDTVVENASLRVACASQTGFAQRLAELSTDSLRAAGAAPALSSLDALAVAHLAASETALFIVSTTGEGDPPDNALAFAVEAMSTTPDLSQLRYALLALGDRRYARYCAFGHALDEWLRRCGATPLFDLIEVDNGDGGALRRWQYEIAQLAGDGSAAIEQADWAMPEYEPWALVSRERINTGSVGGPVHDIRLRARGAMPRWTAGDLVEIGPEHDAASVAAWMQAHGIDERMLDDAQGREPLSSRLARSRWPEPEPGEDVAALAARLEPLPHREYSIASIPEDGDLRLLVRLVQRSDGEHGLGSGWLCLHAPAEATIRLRIRSNPGFHPAPHDAPLILIGNGTGIASLRAHLAQRARAGGQRVWLLFGERQREHDLHYADELDAWTRAGVLARTDFAFSRDPARGPAHPRYVQDALREAGDTLRAWIDDGAHLRVCGSAAGMATGVDDALRDILGDAAVDALRRDGRYRRDVY
jgi:sulfite reductase (NADPH) flavoprotein alpha-component